MEVRRTIKNLFRKKYQNFIIEKLIFKTYFKNFNQCFNKTKSKIHEKQWRMKKRCIKNK